MPEIRIISPTTPEEHLLRVAAYCRVSSDSEDQLHSFAAQVKYYTEQELYTKRSTKTYEKRCIRPLAGKIQCECGHSYKHITANGMDYWECRTHNYCSDKCPSRRVSENDIYEAFIQMVNKLIFYREQIILPTIKYMERLQMKLGGTHIKMHEIDRIISDMNAQSLALARLKSKGIMDAADFAAQNGQISSKVSKLRAERRQLLKEGDENDALGRIHLLNSIFESRESCITEFDEV